MQESKAIDGHTHVTAYTYDEANLVESTTYPSGRTVEYARNVLGQVTEVETTYGTMNQIVATAVMHLPFGPVSGLTFGNSLMLDRDYDLQYRLTDQMTGTVQDFAFTHDAAGNIDAITDSVVPALSQSFTQDALHRVSYEAGVYGTKGYTYDANGNRLTRVHNDGTVVTQTLTYMGNSNRLATHDGLTVSRDSGGNTLADPAENLSFTYDDHNRQTEAYVGAMLQASYVYNGRGQRAKKIEGTGAGGRTIVYHYGLAGELLGETIYASGGAKSGERDYLWLDTLPLAQSERTFSGSTVTSDQFVYLHADQLETPRIATDDMGAVVWRWDSDAFGVGAAELDPDADLIETNVRLRFPGQYFDEETGLHYNYYRDYDPAVGRYVQSDPIGLDGGLNTYLYANGNPLRYKDPYGLNPAVASRALPPAGAALGAAAACALSPDLCREVAQAVCEDVGQSFRDIGQSFNDLLKPFFNQDKRLTPGEINKLKGAGIDPEALKGGRGTGKLDLFKDRDGNIVIKPKDGSGPGEPTGININDL